VEEHSIGTLNSDFQTVLVLDPNPILFHRKSKKNFWLISGLAELSRKVNIMANIRLSANVFGWYLD